MLEKKPFPMASREASKTIDVGQSSEEAVTKQIYQSLVEVSHGIAAEKLVFTNNGNSDSASIRKVAEAGLSNALAGPYRWAVRCYWVQDDEPVLIMLSTRRYNSYKTSYSGLLNALSWLESSTPTPELLHRLANELDNRSLELTVPKRANGIISKLQSIAQGDSMLMAALAAEILTHQGYPTLPTHAIKSTQKAASLVNVNGAANGTMNGTANGTSKHEAVDEYQFFESVHPAYFRQTVALAGLVARYIKDPCPRAIDMGPGPGTNLLAFQEMLPQTEILALESSDTAFHYLKGHFGGNAKVTCLQEDFFNVPADPERIDYFMSTGASHHFSTDNFLQKSVQWLRPGGYWFIADEMISPFETRTQRYLNVMRHHLSYMTPLCFPWPTPDNDVRTPLEREFVDDYNRTVPLAKYHADNGDVDNAEAICRELLTRTDQRGFTNKVSDPQLAFWRLQWLELKALVWGLDYELEQKTCPQYLKKMAEGAGLTFVAHERVHGTVGLSDNDAGTHVMAFQKA